MKKIFLLLLVFVSLLSQAQHKYLIKVGAGGGGSATFQSDIIMNAATGNRLGYWVNGDTIPVAGLSLDAAFQVITQAAVPPTYVRPTATISSSPSSGTYEIGTNLGTITLSSGFNQNNGGALTGTTYYKNVSTPLADSTDVVSSLTSSVSYRVRKYYDSGACIANNLGVIDCTGRVPDSSVYSSSITFTPLPKKYWGVSATFPPSSATIITATGGGSEFATSKAKGSFTITVTGTDLYVYYAYPSSLGALTSITISGLESFGAFTQSTISVTNAAGYTQSYYVYTSNNQFNNTTVSFNSVN
jgi:hypothetical protein